MLRCAIETITVIESKMKQSIEIENVAGVESLPIKWEGEPENKTLGEIIAIAAEYGLSICIVPHDSGSIGPQVFLRAWQKEGKPKDMHHWNKT